MTRRQCHLCEEMEAVLEQTLGPADGAWQAIDVDRHPELLARFDHSVPVLLRDGKPVAKYRLSRRQLLRIVRRRR